MFKINTSIAALTGAIALTALAQASTAQATITIVNNDGPGEGFNDATAVAPVAGNAGTTLGQQRLNAFQAAADAWEGVVSSAVEIRIDAALDALTPCTATGGVLGRAGTNQVFRDFTNAPQANTWFSGALANTIAGIDNDTTMDDIQARFNSSVDNNNACLNNTNWFYGIGVATPANTISFFDTVKHELAHGLGVQSFVDVVSTGALLSGRTDTFTNFLHDHSANTAWPTMTNAERLASATDTGDLHWTGPQVNNCASQILTAGLAGGHVRMFAPSPVQGGSSVSHFDTALAPDELMEPFSTITTDQRLTDRLLADIGWNVTSPTCLTLVPHSVVISRGSHNPAFSPVLHLRSVSRGHNNFISQIHQPIGSSGHWQNQSILHNRIQSFGHRSGSSLGHNGLISTRHSQVSSRFGGFDPSGPVINPADPWINPYEPTIDPRIDPRFDPRIDPRIDPRFDPRMPMGQQLPPIHMLPLSPGHNPLISDRHNPIVSVGHSPFISQGHSPLISQGHNPFLSQGHNPFLSQGHNQWLSQGHNPFVSQGHNRWLSQGHNPLISQGHNPFVSQGHNPFLSQGHNPLLSQGHNILVSQGHNPRLSDFPQHNPLISDPQHSVVGSNIPTPGDPVINPAPQGSEVAPGLERIPGNRSGSAIAPIPFGRPFTVPTQ